MLVTQSFPTLCNPMDWSSPGSSVHGILQARILEWRAIPFFRGSSWPRDLTQVSCTAGRFYTLWATREALWVLCRVAHLAFSMLWRRYELYRLGRGVTRKEVACPKVLQLMNPGEGFKPTWSLSSRALHHWAFKLWSDHSAFSWWDAYQLKNLWCR